MPTAALTLALALLVAAAAIDVFVRTTGPARKAGRPALWAALAFSAVLVTSALNQLLAWNIDQAHPAGIRRGRRGRRRRARSRPAVGTLDRVDPQ